MKKIYYLALALTSLASINFAYGQTISVVRDLNPGAGDGFDQWNYTGAEINGTYLLPAKTADDNLELYAIENGDITLVKDINTNGSSSPSSFTLFNDKVYFIAEDETYGREIWSSDGTAAGTAMTIDIVTGAASGAPEDLFAARNGKLYFSSQGKVYVSDGTTAGTEEIAGVTNVSFSEHSGFTSPVITNYLNGVAFFSQSGSTVIIYYHDGTTLTTLHEFTAGTFSAIYGLSEVSVGLLYAVNDSFYPEYVGLFVITSSGNVTELLDDQDASLTVYRVLEFTQTRSIFKTADGIYATDGTTAGTVKITEGTYSLFSGEEMPHIVVGDKMVLKGSEYFTDEEVYITDGTVNGTTKIAITNSYLSPMISNGSQVFWFAGTTNGFDSQIWMYDTNTGISEMLHEGTGSSTGPNALPITVMGGKLYFNSTLFGEGRELYAFSSDRIASKLSASTQIFKLLAGPELNSYVLKSEGADEILGVKQYDINGRVLKSMEVRTNQSFQLIPSSGLSLLEVSGEKGISSFKVITRN